MLVSHAGYAVKEGKKHAGPQPQKWVRVAAQAKGTFQETNKNRHTNICIYAFTRIYIYTHNYMKKQIRTVKTLIQTS